MHDGGNTHSHEKVFADSFKFLETLGIKKQKQVTSKHEGMMMLYLPDPAVTQPI